MPGSETSRQGVSLGEVLIGAFTRYGDRTAFVQEDRTYTYRQAADLLARMISVFNQRGVGAGSAIAALSPNCAEVFLAQTAAWLAGGRYSGLHPLGSFDDQLYTCDDAEFDLIVAHPAFASRAAGLAEKAATVKQVLTLGPTDGVGEDLLALCEQAAPARLHPGPAREDDLCWLQYTGGTTGRPKGVELSHRSIVQTIYSTLCSWEIPAQPRYLAASPITHAALVPLLPTLVLGGEVHLHTHFDPQHWLDTVEKQHINYALAVPSMIYALLDHGDPTHRDTSSLVTVNYGAAPMAPSRLAEAHEAIGPVFTQVYGQTECAAIGTSLLKAEHHMTGAPDLLRSCGRPVVGARVEVLDDDNQQVEDGTIGEICIQGPSVMDGYWKLPDETSSALSGGWLHTSDMAFRDEDGFLFIVDRKKDMIITGGFNVYPREIEDVLNAHPGISAAAVIGVPDEKWGEAVKAIVVARPGNDVDVDELVALVKEHKGPHHAPKSIEVVDGLPMTGLGKVDKAALRADYWHDNDRQVN